MKLGFLLSFCVAFYAAPVLAQESSITLNNPDVAALTVYGASGSVIDDAKVPGGKAYRVDVDAKGANAWDAAVLSQLREPVKAGDPLVLSFWARLVSGENGATSADLPWNSVSLSSAPWTQVFGGPVAIGPEWKLYEVRGTADKDYAAGALNAGIQVASAKQTIDFGPVTVAKASGGGAAAATPTAAPSGLASLDPAKLQSMIINDPGAPQVNKAKARLVADERVTGGKALRVTVAAKGKNPWDSNVASAIKKPVKAGDNLLLVFWARLEQGENGATNATLPSNGVNLTSPPWSGLLGGPADIGPEWKQFELKGLADKDYAPGALTVSLQMATARQTVDLGPIILLDLGQ